MAERIYTDKGARAGSNTSACRSEADSTLHRMHLVIAALNRHDRPSGICRYAANLASCLATRSRISEITIAIGSWQQHYFRDLLGEDSPVKLLPISTRNNSIERNQWYWRDLSQLATQLSCDIMHCCFPVPVRRSGFQGLIVTTVHDMYAFSCPENFGFPAVLFNRAFFRQALRASDGVVCDSQETLDCLVRHFRRLPKKKKVSVIPCCVDFGQVKLREPAFLSLLTAGEFLLCVAQHRKNKNLDLLIKAFAALKFSGRMPAKLHLIIVGNEGPETPKIKQLASDLQVTENIIFVSGLANEELAWLYKHCQLLLIPSSQEGFCLPLVEGMFFGARIVCSDIRILREVGSQNCFFFDLYGGPEALTTAMCRGMSAPQPEYGSAIERYKPTIVGDLQLRFYENLGRG